MSKTKLKENFLELTIPGHHELSENMWFMQEWDSYVTQFLLENIESAKFLELIKDKKRKIMFTSHLPLKGLMEIAAVEDELTWGYFFYQMGEEATQDPDFFSDYNYASYFCIVCKMEDVYRVKKEIVDKITAQCIRVKTNKSFKMITRSATGLRLAEAPIPLQEIDLALNYGDDFLAKDKIVQEFIASDEAGIMLFHGVAGSGKSTYLKHVIQKSTRDVIFLPLQMVDALTTPDFADFMLGQKNKTLIIEDAEDILLDRKANRFSAAVSTILNLSSGLLADALKLKIVCTFNMDIQDIDTAVMRKGRLKLIYQFGPLSVENSNRLFKHLNKGVETKNPMTLANIYNFGTETCAEDQDVRKIGF